MTHLSAAGASGHRILSDEQVDSYEERGYLLVEAAIGDDWLERLRSASAQFVEESRALSESDHRIDVESGHTADQPRLRRLTGPVDQHPAFAEFALAGPAADIAVDLLGAPARFHHSKLNYKWSGGGQQVEWHQDIQYWPHTDFTPLTLGVYLDDVTFISDKSLFSTAGPVRFLSADVEMLGRGLELVYNEELERLEFFRVVNLQSLRLSSGKTESLSKTGSG